MSESFVLTHDLCTSTGFLIIIIGVRDVTVSLTAMEGLWLCRCSRKFALGT